MKNYLLHQKMLQYSLVSVRDDGTSNRVVMNGKEGRLGYSSVRLSYLTDGWIQLSGENNEDSNGWKLISEFILEPGTYTLTGMKGQQENTVALQMYIEDEWGNYRYLYQYDDDVQFTVDHFMNSSIHVRVYPTVKNVDVKARPAVYRDE